MTVKTKVPPITAAEYEAIVRPVRPRTSEELFDYEVETLVRFGSLRYEQADPLRRLIPERGLFLLIPPRPDPLDLTELMRLVVVDGESGRNYLDPAKLRDEVALPRRETSYIALDVEDGRQTLDIPPFDCGRRFKAEGRSGSTCFEGIVLAALFPWVLTHFIDLPGSRCGSEDVPYLGRWYGRPWLSARWGARARPRGGSASCGSRLVA